MVPPSSNRISRVPPYSSWPGSSLFRVRGFHPLSLAFPNHSTKTIRLVVTGLLRFRSPLLTESQLMSFPLGTEMFQFPRFASLPLFIQGKMTFSGRVSPFRYHRITARLPAPRCFSQATTSFFAFYCLGIRHMRFVTWPYKHETAFPSFQKNCLSLAYASWY